MLSAEGAYMQGDDSDGTASHDPRIDRCGPASLGRVEGGIVGDQTDTDQTRNPVVHAKFLDVSPPVSPERMHPCTSYDEEKCSSRGPLLLLDVQDSATTSPRVVIALCSSLERGAWCSATDRAATQIKPIPYLSTSNVSRWEDNNGYIYGTSEVCRLKPSRTVKIDKQREASKHVDWQSSDGEGKFRRLVTIPQP
ncbi:hypothetical protein AB1N83_004926 [Pleurotus pulmonarius]